ncbi:catechol 1,2-dioxygenase [compost metagenome]
MTHSEIDALVHSFIVATGTQGTPDPRVQQVVVRLTADLFKAIEDLDLSASEVWKGIEYFAEAGATQELGLLAAGLGLERFLDVRADEAEARAGLAGGTPRTIEGPLYVAGAPESTGFARLDDGSDDGKGEVLFMQGTVYGADGKPLPGAKVEVWHANLMGNYSFFDKTQSHFNLWDDFAFASREGLVPAVNRIADAAALDQHGVDKPFASIDFDFRLLPEQEGAPPAEVERLRAAA